MKLQSILNSIYIAKSNINKPDIRKKYFTEEKVDSFIRTTVPSENTTFIPIDIEDEVSERLKNSITSTIKAFPPKWMKLFKENGYKIIITDDINKIIKENGINSFEVNPSTTMGLTYTNKNTKQNFFCFSNKINPKFARNIVSHEFGHGICNIEDLYNSQKMKSCLSKDIDSIIKERKLDKLSEEERKLLSKYFFQKDTNMPLDEIIADLFACSQDNSGCYGSELMLSKEHSELMPYLFPSLYEQIKVL